MLEKREQPVMRFRDAKGRFLTRRDAVRKAVRAEVHEPGKAGFRRVWKGRAGDLDPAKRRKLEPTTKDLYFTDAKGRPVKDAERYDKAAHVYKVTRRKVRGKVTTVVDELWQGKPGRLRPRTFAGLMRTGLVSRDQLEALAPAFGPEKTLTTRTRKYTAWDLAGQLERSLKAMPRTRGRLVEVTMMVRDGKRMRKVKFLRNARAKGDFRVSMFNAMNEAIGLGGMNLYTRIGSKILPDRKGRTVSMTSLSFRTVL